MKIPQNQIKTGLYTIGKEFVDKKTHEPYQGYYYELSNKYFAGKEFNNSAPEIIKVSSSNFNKLLLNKNTKTYGSLSKLSLIFTNIKFKSLPEGGEYSIQHSEGRSGDEGVFFYCKKYNSDVIKKIDEETYNSLKQDILYMTTFVGRYNGVYQTLDTADKQVPGVKDWVVSDARGY
jgi:hypothetical protein